MNTHAELIMLIEAVRKIPEKTAERPIVMGYADDYGPGRHAKAEFSPETSGYDYLYAELCMEKDAEKAKVRNRRRADRKHNILPKVRKQMRYDRGWNRYRSMPCYGCKNIGIAEYRMDNAESVARADWEIEQRDIEIARLDAEIMAEYAEWEARREFEDMCRKLNEWLKYA